MWVEDSESAAARAERAAGLSQEEYEEIALDGMEAVYYGDRGHDPQVRAGRLRAARVYGPERFAAHSVAIGSRPDRWDFPSKASCPVLIVGASDDQVVPTDEQRQWAEANSAPHVTYVEIPETGHMLPVEAPAQLAGVLSDWLSSLEGLPRRTRGRDRLRVGRGRVSSSSSPLPGGPQRYRGGTCGRSSGHSERTASA